MQLTRGNRAWRRLIVCSALAMLARTSVAAESVPDPRTLLAKLPGLSLDEARSAPVHELELLEGFARIRLHEGRVTPVTPLGPRSMEVVFIGRGGIAIDPPDEVEAGQLDLFTGSRTLDAEFQEAVFVVPQGATLDRLLAGTGGASAPDRDGSSRQRAQDLWKLWKNGPVRRFIGVDGVLLRAGCDERAAEEFFAGWLRSTDLGDIVYQVDPDDEEPVTLGHFVPLDLKGRELKKTQREIEEEQEHSHWVGLTLADLGRFDVWMSAAFSGPNGAPVLGTSPFEPEHYVLDVTVDRFVESISGKARIELHAVRGGRRAVPLTLGIDLRVDGIKDGAGHDLLFLRAGSEVTVFLPAPLEEGAKATLEIAYSGNPFYESSLSTFALRGALGWYPHAGSRDRATYDVTIRWPKKYDLLASGPTAAEGIVDGVRWERHVIDKPTIGVTFETGNFDIHKTQAGHVAVTVAFDRDMDIYHLGKDARQEIVDTVEDSLSYFEEIYGTYPLDELKVVSVPRAYSQGLTGFVTLEDYVLLMMSNPVRRSWLAASSLGHSRRTVVAHEVAHQWWGSIVQTSSYRDQWLEEALADYSALLFMRNRLKVDVKALIAPTKEWQDELEETTSEGRPLESIGPLTLGRRLSSSKSEAYITIIYAKGPIVINMLEKVFKEDAFVKILGGIARELAGQTATTRQFFAAVEERSHVDLDWFVDQYVNGTGMPDILYNFRIGSSSNGTWKISGTLRLLPPRLFRYRVVANPDYDVRREVIPQSPDQSWKLIIPVQIPIHREDPGSSRRDDPHKINAQVNGRLLMDEMGTPFSVEIEQKPLGLWLDRYGEVLAHFCSETRFPRTARRFDGQDLAAAGKRDEAEAVFRSALAAPSLGTPDGAEVDPTVLKRDELRARREETWIHLELARLQIEHGRAGEAEQEMNIARHDIQDDESWFYRDELLVLDSRLDLLKGDAAGAFRRLRAGILNRGIDNVEAYALLAVAAKRAGRPDDLTRWVDLARRHGVDVKALEAP